MENTYPAHVQLHKTEKLQDVEHCHSILQPNYVMLFFFFCSTSLSLVLFFTTKFHAACVLLLFLLSILLYLYPNGFYHLRSYFSKLNDKPLLLRTYNTKTIHYSLTQQLPLQLFKANTSNVGKLDREFLNSFCVCFYYFWIYVIYQDEQFTIHEEDIST